MTPHAGTQDDGLNPRSLTRLLARSLLLEALGRMPPPSQRCAAPILLANRPSSGRIAYWTRARILAELRAFVTRTGTFPTCADWQHARAMGLPSRQTVVRQWGSLGAVRDQLRAEMPSEASEGSA